MLWQRGSGARSFFELCMWTLMGGWREAEGPRLSCHYEAAHKYLYEIQKAFDQTSAHLKRPNQAAMPSESGAATIGPGPEPTLKPIGFDWKIATAFLGSFAAKEVFVAQMGIVFSVGGRGDEPR